MVCNGNSGEIFTCSGNLKYDTEQEKCVANLDTTAICDNRCMGISDGRFVADPTNCRGCYYCLNGEAYASSCDWQYYFNETRQECVYPRDSTCKDVNNICELVKDKTAFRNENDCSQYYVCSKGVQKPDYCKNQYFNVEKGSCDKKKNVICNAHPIAANLCPKNITNIVKKADGGSCRGYFVCAPMGEFAQDEQPIWFQCPAGKLFSEAQGECLDPIDVKCDYNRCDGRGNMLVNSSFNNCRNYIKCENNLEVEEYTCGDNYFFNERLQACVPYIIYFKCCDQPATHPNVKL
ncbi:peritrophin-44-like [Lucilia sericata]|uniref:peritrophin-44-like n=1 Tax=Lucilia sericata TaxID=13632 RepID=UPI0018A83785|nr:peritrophin-44-like [Lucilia sericata]